MRKANLTPMIRYQSLSMPVMVLSESSMEKEDEKINVEGDDEKTLDDQIYIKSLPNEKSNANANELLALETNRFYERTFITFENQQLFTNAFKKTPSSRPSLKSLCAITRYTLH